jgi:hypothetical protein
MNIPITIFLSVFAFGMAIILSWLMWQIIKLTPDAIKTFLKILEIREFKKPPYDELTIFQRPEGREPEISLISKGKEVFRGQPSTKPFWCFGSMARVFKGMEL